MERTKRRGRPSKAPKPGKKMALSVLASPALKTRLDRAARTSGGSLSAEMEARLERSFDDEDRGTIFSERLYGRRLSQLLQIIGQVMRDVGPLALFQARLRIGDWFDDPAAYYQAKAAAIGALEALAPPGDPSPPAEFPSVQVSLDGKSSRPAESLHDLWKVQPRRFVAMYLLAIAGDPPNGTVAEFVSSLGDLGPFVERAAKAIGDEAKQEPTREERQAQ